MVQFDTIESLIQALQASPRSDGREKHFRVTRTEVDPILPREMFGFPVYEFDAAGNPIYPTGGNDNPWLFAINQRMRNAEQVETFLGMVLATIFRRASTEQVEKGTAELNEHLVSLGKVEDGRAEQKAKSLLRIARAEESVSNIASYFESLGVYVVPSIELDLRSTRSSVLNSITFFRNVYNSSQVVRSVIDRVVYAIVGGGFRTLAGSEAIRRFTERRQAGLAIQHIIAQSVRDAQLFGTSCMIFSAESDIAVRLIRPDLLDFSSKDNRLTVIDRSSEQVWPVVDDSPLIVRGVAQRQSPFGVSILEPVVPLLANILTLSKALNALALVPPDVPREFLDSSREPILAADRMRSEAEEQLKRLFQFPETRLPLDRDNLYFPGWELWQE